MGLYCKHCSGVADYDWRREDDVNAYRCLNCGRALDASLGEVLVGPARGRGRYRRGEVEAEFGQQHHAELVNRGWQPMELQPLEVEA